MVPAVEVLKVTVSELIVVSSVSTQNRSYANDSRPIQGSTPLNSWLSATFMRLNSSPLVEVLDLGIIEKKLAWRAG